jgi:hypothetical protein
MTTVPTQQGEQWKFIPGWGKRYLISNLGRVYSMPRKVRTRGANLGRVTKRQVTGRMLALRKHPNGGMRVNLTMPTKFMSVSIGPIVANVFVRRRKLGEYLAYKNGNVEDCRADNLEYRRWGGAHAKNSRETQVNNVSRPIQPNELDTELEHD